MRGHTNPKSPLITTKVRNTIKAADLNGFENTHATRQTQEKWQAQQNREIEAAKRARARTEKEREEWETEIAEYDKEETSRRQRKTERL